MNVYPVATGGYVVYLSADALGNALLWMPLTGVLVWSILRHVLRHRGDK